MDTPTRRQTHAQACTALVVRVQEGDEGAWDTLWHALWAPIMGFLRKRDLQYHDAEDVAAMTLLRVYKGIPEYDPSLGGALSWALAIAANEYANHWRMRTQQKRDYRIVDSMERPVKSDGGGHIELLGETISHDDRTLEHMYWQEQIERARRFARERTRNPETGKTGGPPSLVPRVLDAALAFGTASYVELAELTDMSVPQVKAGMHRLRKVVGPRMEWD